MPWFYHQQHHPTSPFPSAQDHLRLYVSRAGKLVAGVRKLRDALPAPIDHVIAAIQGISDTALAAIATAAATPTGDGAGALLATLRELVRLNHCLLNGLGVGHAALDDVVGVTAKEGFASKLTGAGGGGCAMTLLPPMAEGTPEGKEGEVRVHTAVETLRSRGFDCFETRLGGAGLLLLRR